MEDHSAVVVPEPSAPNIRQAVPFFWVRDIQSALRFYVDGLGCRLTKQWTPEGKLQWCWLELGGTALMLQEFWRDGQHRNVPESPLGVGLNTCYVVQDAIALYHEFQSRGLEPARPFVGNGMWVTEVVDPDGYKLFFESKTDVPEETEYEG